MRNPLVTIIIVSVMSACGKQGATGAAGMAGAPGSPGTVITLVQLCGSCVPIYPSVFVEYAECIDSQLYGVYSNNDGFLSLLPPGQYSSDGINCSCDFTISSNCVVED